jgi:hypothetical protein
MISFQTNNINEEQESTPLLRLLEDILYNRIKQKKQEMHKTHNRADTDHIWTEIEKHFNGYYHRVLVSEGCSICDTIIINNNDNYPKKEYLFIFITNE